MREKTFRRDGAHVRDFAGHVSLATTPSYVHKLEDSTVAQAMQEALG